MAILLPRTIPILWLNDRIFEFIKVIVSIISAELDWIINVEKNPVNRDFWKDEVNFFRLFCILKREDFIRLFDKDSKENTNKDRPPSNRVIFTCFTS